MKNQAPYKTRCFAGEKDDWPLVTQAHKEPVVIGIADLMLTHPALLLDLSRLLLNNVPIIPPNEPRISDLYRDQNGGDLSDEQKQLASLLDMLYSISRQDILNARRGAVLEHIAFKAIRKRIIPRQYDEIVLNIAGLRPSSPGSHSVSNYSVDIATCLPQLKTVEFYACKLHSDRLSEDELAGLDEVGDSFVHAHWQVFTSACVLEEYDNLDPDFLDRHKLFPYISLFCADNLADLAIGPGGLGEEEGEEES